jgi:hypothetical protein
MDLFLFKKIKSQYMKTLLLITAVWFVFSVSSNHAYAQTIYSFSITNILNSMPTGTRLPDGTIVKAEKIVTGIGVHSAASGTSNPANMGGTFTGITLPSYVGDHTPSTFSVIETTSSNTIDNGINTRCQNSIGFRIFFDRPTLKISFLAVDIDGNNTNPGNAEWVSQFAFNGNTYVPYDHLLDATLDTSLETANITAATTSPHTWRTLITNKIGATAAANLPDPMPINRAAGGGYTPDDPRGQVLFNPANPAAAVTDFFLVWGIYQSPAAPTVQTSGLSPVVVKVSPDFGDAPDSYKTLLASGGPSHGVVGTLLLGATDVTEGDGLPSVNADNSADDDGVASVPLIPNDGSLSQLISTYSLTTSFTNNVGVAANYVAWIDWNNNGTFEPSEAQVSTSSAGATSGIVIFTWNNVTLSGTAGRANTYARIRVTTEAITTADVGGAFKDGEVEDYLIPFATVLPVRLSYFSGKIDNNHVLLSWKTASENNTSHFEIERSADGRNFISIGRVNAGTVPAAYSFIDPSPVASGINFYRLAVVDKDDRHSYSSIIRINTMNTSFKASIAPNPATAMINLVIENSLEKEKLLFELVNTNGELIYNENISASGSVMVKSIPRPAASGLYFYKITRINGETYNGKLVVQ